jgi:hypothetical protein
MGTLSLIWASNLTHSKCKSVSLQTRNSVPCKLSRRSSTQRPSPPHSSTKHLVFYHTAVRSFPWVDHSSETSSLYFTAQRSQRVYIYHRQRKRTFDGGSHSCRHGLQLLLFNHPELTTTSPQMLVVSKGLEEFTILKYSPNVFLHVIARNISTSKRCLQSYMPSLYGTINGPMAEYV